MPRAMMWANMRTNKVGQGTISVPSPFDGDASVPWWYDRIASLAHEWAAAGFTDVLFPNPLMTESRAFETADGYGVNNDYDIGTETKPTRFGSGERFRRAVAICHANGLNVILDHVMHQRSGGKNGVYEYPGADGKTLNGRFPKHPSCFRGAPPRVPQDPVPAPSDDFAFGDELCPVNAQPQGYVWDGLIEAGDWLFRTSGADGARIDDTKGMNIGFVKAFMNSKAMKDLWFFGEYASGNRNDTDWWVSQVDGRASSLDFDFHYNVVMPMCNDAGSGTYHMGRIAGRGMIASWPMRAVPFVESMDSDTNGFATVVNNKLLGYALLLTGEGLPMAYIRDYLDEPDCYGLDGPIKNLAWIHNRLAAGGTTPRLTDDPRCYVFERTAGAGLLVVLSNDVWNPDWRTVTVHTNHAAGTRLHDYTGHTYGDTWVKADGTVDLAVPPGANGRGYSCWAPAGLGGDVPINTRSTTQVFVGAADLQLGPIPAAGTITVGRVWSAANAPIAAELRIDPAGWQQGTHATVKVIDPAGTVLTTFTSSAAVSVSHCTPRMTGWHTFYLTGVALPADAPFELAVTYTAPRTL